MVMEVEAVDGDAGVGNEVFYEIISGKLNHNNLKRRRIMSCNIWCDVVQRIFLLRPSIC